MSPPAGVLAAISGYGHCPRFERNVHWRDDAMPLCLIDTQWPIPSLGSWRNSTGPDFLITSNGDRFTDPDLRIGSSRSRPSRAGRPRSPEISVAPDLEAGAPRFRPEATEYHER